MNSLDIGMRLRDTVGNGNDSIGHTITYSLLYLGSDCTSNAQLHYTALALVDVQDLITVARWRFT